MLSRYCPDIVQNIDYLLSKYCINTARTFSKYFLDIGQLSPKYYPNIIRILSKYCQDIVKNIDYILPKYCMNTVWILPKYCTNNVLILPKYCPNNV